MKYLRRYKVFESSESVYSFEDYTRSLNFIKNKVAPYTIVRDFFTESEISVIENSLDYYNYINNYKVNVTANNIPSEDVPNLNVIRIEILVHGNPVIYHLEKWTDGWYILYSHRDSYVKLRKYFVCDGLMDTLKIIRDAI